MKLTVRMYLLTAFVVACMTPLIVFCFWPYSSIVGTKVDEVHERHLLIAQNLSKTLEVYYRDMRTAFDSFASSIAQGDAEAAKPVFENLNFRHICVVDRETGQVRRSYLTQTHACPETVPKERLALFRSLVPDTVFGMSHVVLGPGQRPILYLVEKLDDVYVVGAIHTDFFIELQRSISFGARGHAAIVDHTGRVLAHPLKQWEETARDVSEMEPVRRVMQGETGVAEFYSKAMKAQMIAGFTTVPVAGWGVLVPQPLAEFEEASRQFTRDTLIILLIGLALSCALAVAVSNFFSARIESIARQVRQVGAGEGLTGLVPFAGRFVIKEFSALQLGLNHMAHATAMARREVSDRNRQLEDINTTLRDEIHERQVAEELRMGSEARFQGLFESAPIPIRIEDLSGIKRALDGLKIANADDLETYLQDNPDFVRSCGHSIVVVDANRASLELHGYKDKSNMLPAVTRDLSPDSMEVVRQTILAIHAGRTQLSYEIPIYPANGGVKHVATSWVVIAGHEDSYDRTFLTSVDLSERVQSEERILKAQKMEAVGQLTGGIAHDFNNLLTVIGGNADLIQEDITNAQTYVTPIRNAVARGSELTQRLLAFSRQQPLAPRVVDLTELIGDMTEVLRRTLGETVAVDLQFDTDLWTVLADPNQIANALLNLGLNARDAMPNGGALSIACRNTVVVGRENDDLKDGNYVVLEVADTGTGMSADALSRAVEPFFTTKPVGAGSGLGLSMVYGFAKQSNGHVDIASTLGQGTTVQVFLPCGLADPDIKRAIEPTTGVVNGNGQRILVLEDQIEIRAYLLQMLTLMGYDPLPAGTAQEATDILAQNSDVRAALCDIMLPGGVSGLQFAESALQKDPELKVIFISGRPPVDQTLKSGLLKDRPLITKPFDSKTLGALLQDHLNMP